jgi:hypothetical protein
MLCKKLAKQKKGVLFLIDEVQSTNPVMREFATTYQHLVGDDCNIALAMAGLPFAISSVLNDTILTFLNRAHKDHLEPLSLCDVSVFYSKVFADAGVTIEAGILEELVQATKGYPYLMQLIGYHVSQICEGQKSITRDAAETATINAKRQLEENLFLPCLRPLSTKETAFLKAMAVDHGPSSTKDIKERLGVASSYIQPYRKRLIAAGAIDSPSRGFLEFRIPYLGEYLRGKIERASDIPSPDTRLAGC